MKMRCNIGVDPKYLLDQHLIAEYRELPMVIGSLEYNNWKIKGKIPDQFKLGSGHINFFKNKLRYLERRHNAVRKECLERRFDCFSLHIDASELIKDHPDLYSDWRPTINDSLIIRERIIERLLNRNSISPNFWRYFREVLTDKQLKIQIELIRESELFEV
jgi:deoxyribonuclease (pyrimidine dimer)